MDRRGFLKFFGAGVAGIAIEQAIPLGRVWSFPKEIVLPSQQSVTVALTQIAGIDWGFAVDPVVGDGWAKKFAIGSTINVRFPQRFLVRDGMSYLTTATAAALRASRRLPS